MGKDELLTIRLTELKEDVGLVRQMLTRAKKRGDQLTKVSDLVKPVGDDTIGESLATARRRVEDLIINFSGDDELTAQLEVLREDLFEVSKRLGKAAQAATVVGERMRDLDSIMDTEHRNITDSLFYARDMIRDIETAINELDSDTDQEDAWKAFDELVLKCEPLFTDYVDFLSGVTLRDHGLEDGVAAVADRVFKELAVGGIAVPARQGDLPTKLASLAKFQFPEWTVWDVPLAGYHAGLSRSTEIGQSIINEFCARHHATFPTEVFARQLFAEVYAACMVGPAYGYAALLLHLHPRKTQRTDDSPSAADRANVILATLEYYAGDNPVVRDQVKRLADRWSFAAGGAPVPDRDAEIFAEFVSLVVSERLDETIRPAPYDWVRWRSATDDVTDIADIVPGRHVLVLDLLNALWQLRVTNPSAVEGLTAEALISGARPGRSARPAATSTMQRQARPNETGGFGG